MAALLHVRLIVDVRDRDAVLDYVRSHVGTVNLVHVPGGALQPPGDVILFDVAREASNEVLEWLQHAGVHERGTINVVHAQLSIGAATELAHHQAPGEAEATVFWAEVEAEATSECDLTVSYLVYFAVAAVIAAIGILVDSPVLIVGAMVVGPEYGPVSAITYFFVRRRWRSFTNANITLFAGTFAGALTAFAITVVIRIIDRVPDAYREGARPLTGFVNKPDVLSAMVAVAAAVAGVLAITHERAGTVVGVLVSVTTMPAIAAAGVAAAFGDWHDMWGAAGQFTLNVTCLILAGALTFVVLRHLTPRSLSALERGFR